MDGNQSYLKTLLQLQTANSQILYWKFYSTNYSIENNERMVNTGNRTWRCLDNSRMIFNNSEFWNRQTGNLLEIWWLTMTYHYPSSSPPHLWSNLTGLCWSPKFILKRGKNHIPHSLMSFRLFWNAIGNAIQFEYAI